MKQIQKTVPQNTASRKRHYSAPTRRPDPASGAQIQGQIPPSKQKQREREASKPPQRQGAQKSARRVEATQESIPYLTLRARTDHRVVSSPPHVVAACPASLLPQAARADPGGRKRAAPAPAAAAAAAGGVCGTGRKKGAAAGLPDSTRVALRYFL